MQISTRTSKYQYYIVAGAMILIVFCLYKIYTFKPTHHIDSKSLLNWNRLQLLDYKNDIVPERLKIYDGANVMIPGFMIPLEDSAPMVSEFLLVPMVTGCIHVPPPPPNQVVNVKMKQDGAQYSAQPIVVSGKLIIEHQNHRASLRMEATQVQPYQGYGFQIFD